MSIDAASSAAAAVRRAAARLAEMEAARDRAIADAVAGGAGIRAVGRAVGLSHVRVLQITRRAAGDGATEPESSATGGPPCRRLGCAAAAVTGSAFCEPHGRY